MAFASGGTVLEQQLKSAFEAFLSQTLTLVLVWFVFMKFCKLYFPLRQSNMIRVYQSHQLFDLSLWIVA